jgi:hypothetical protein
MDVNNDGNLDLVGVGNFYWTDVVIGKYDAMKGFVMLGDGNGGFSNLKSAASGFLVDKDARALARIETKNNLSILITSAILDSLSIHRLEKTDGSKRILPTEYEISAILFFPNGKRRKLEIDNTSGYLSASSRSIIISREVKSIDLFSSSGRKTRTITF